MVWRVEEAWETIRISGSAFSKALPLVGLARGRQHGTQTLIYGTIHFKV